MVTLVDANVFLDVATADPSWGGWSREALAAAADAGRLAINQVIFAELGARYETEGELDEAFPETTF